MAVAPLASHVELGAGGRRALGVPRASFYRRQRPAPGHQQPRPTPTRALNVRPNGAAHPRTCLPARIFKDRSPDEVVATCCSLEGSVSGCRAHDVPLILAANHAGARAAQSAQSSLLHQARAGGSRAPTRPGPGISPGSGGPNAGRPSTSMSCSTSSAAASWAGWLPIGRTPRSPRR